MTVVKFAFVSCFWKWKSIRRWKAECPWAVL